MTLNILCISWGTAGNLSPVLTAARQLRAAGHRVRLMADPAMHDEIALAGFPFAAWRRAPTGAAADPADFSDLSAWLAQAVFDPAGAYAADARDEILRTPTDAVLLVDLLFGCALGAEAAGVPFAILSPHVSIRPLQGLPPASTGLTPPTTEAERAEIATITERLTGLLDTFLPALNGVRRDLGLDPLEKCFDVFDRADRVLLAISEAFDFTAEAHPVNYRYIGPLLDEPGWSHDWNRPWSETASRPRILIAGSTGAQNQADLIARIVRAAATLDVEAVVTTGPNLHPEELPAPDNVHVVPAAPHNAVMHEVSLVVSQGGHGTVSRALINNLPLLILPMARDQADNAARVEVRGAGLRLAPEASEAKIAEALRRLLDEPRFGEAAARLGSAIRRDVDASGLPREIEVMVAARRARHGLAAAGRRSADAA